jgi:hypothetical protein
MTGNSGSVTKGADGSLSPLKHHQKRLSNPHRTLASALVPCAAMGQRPVSFNNCRSSTGRLHYSRWQVSLAHVVAFHFSFRTK